ncbi:MAG TPA: hypothetical protein VJ825_14030 [Gemmatimonadaceae bacterium]|nr:hypothetical protein [Gemmatimonadaceae bacterium]
MIRVAKNVDAASWISSRLHPFAKDVGSIIPEGFAAYARIFHPPSRLTPEGSETPVRWRDIAAANNRTVAAEMQQLDSSCQPSACSASGERLWNQQTPTGMMPQEIVAKLAPILSAHTRTPELCWFGVWEGFAILAQRVREAPSFSVPERNLYLLYGALDDVLDTLSRSDWIYRSPTLWWPDDRAWCVVTEIDFTWSYVGGSQACIEQILGDNEIEALPTNPEEGNLMHTKEQIQEMWSRSRRAT